MKEHGCAVMFRMASWHPIHEIVSSEYRAARECSDPLPHH
jgi:hypothetical protein